MTADPRQRMSLVPIVPTLGHTHPQARWRTEAMRSHMSPRLIFISKGQGRITVAGLTSGYGANNLIFIPARVMYGYELGTTAYGQMLTIPQAMAGEWPDEPAHLRLKDVSAQKEVLGILDQLERELTTARPGHARAAFYHIGLLAVAFQRQHQARPGEARDERSQTAAARLVAAFTDLVERDFRQSRGVGDYSRALGVTATHLTRCCRATCGRSALSLLNDRIIYEARQMLRDTRTPVQDIAASLGFSSAAYFSRSFLARAGDTPSAFRRKGQAMSA